MKHREVKQLPACLSRSVNAEDARVWPEALLCGGYVFLEQSFEYFIVVHLGIRVLGVGMQCTPWQKVTCNLYNIKGF